MATKHLIFLSIAGLRPSDVRRAITPTLHKWAASGAIAELEPTFPCVTSCVQASMMTGTVPGEHGVIANGFLHRDRQAVEFWVGRNDLIAGQQIWEAIRAKRPELTSAVWHVQNIKGAGADFIVTPAPIHADDGTTRPWCYSKPEGLYQRIVDRLGHFPLQHYWGPMANIESTRWILRAALWLINKHRPNYHWIYIPHLDYAAQKFGPNSHQAAAALIELDEALAEFAGGIAAGPIADDLVYLVAGEYALTDVTGAVYPNRILREAGLLAVRKEDSAEHIDLSSSKAFALVDHQLAHVYVCDADSKVMARCCELFDRVPDIAAVYAQDARRRIGMQHDRSGEIVLIADDTHWFAYYWWLEEAAAPPFARTVDIHRKPGYDPLELFLNPVAPVFKRCEPRVENPCHSDLVRGSHGVPATGPQHRTALICSARSDVVEVGRTYRDIDIKPMSLALLGCATAL
ncbi:MAG: alkaline phosphatase family protein [Planctomycetota bacterium]